MYSIYGYVYTKDIDGNCVPAVNVAVYPYFKKVDSGSSNSKWASPYYTDNNGYYTLTLEDDQFLGINATYKRGKDEVYLAIVDGGDKTLTATNLTHASFTTHLLTNNDYNEINIDLLPVRKPIILSYSIPDVVNTQHDILLSETSKINENWESPVCGNVDISQKRKYALVDIFTAHELDNTVYDYGDAQIVAAPNTNATYKYTTAGDRNINITVNEKWGTKYTINKLLKVEYNEPIVDFSYNPDDIVGNVEVTFTNNTTDLDNRANTYTYDLIIEDTDVNGNQANKIFSNLTLTDTPKYTFQSAGTKNVTLICYWNDGYVDKSVSITKTLNVKEYTISIDNIFQDIIPKDRNTNTTIIANISGNTDKIQQYTWDISDYYALYNPDNQNYGVSITDNSVSNTVMHDGNVITSLSITHSFQSNDLHDVILTIDYFTGWETKQVKENYTVQTDVYRAYANYNTNPNTNDYTFYGKQTITFNDDSNDPDNRFIKGNFTIDDVDLDNNSHIIISPDIERNGSYQYTFQYPSRKPFSAVNGDIDNVYNKVVTYTIVYDDGYEDTAKNSIVRHYEASPLEVSTSINMQCNLDGVKW